MLDIKKIGKGLVLSGAVLLLINAVVVTIALDILIFIAIARNSEKHPFFTGFILGMLFSNFQRGGINRGESLIAMLICSPVTTGLCIALALYLSIPPLAFALGGMFGLGLVSVLAGTACLRISGMPTFRNFFYNSTPPASRVNDGEPPPPYSMGPTPPPYSVLPESSTNATTLDASTRIHFGFNQSTLAPQATSRGTSAPVKTATLNLALGR